MEPIETLLFDFGVRSTRWRSLEEPSTHFTGPKGLISRDAFAPIFFAADDPLVGSLSSTAGLSKRSLRWPQTSKPN